MPFFFWKCEFSVDCPLMQKQPIVDWLLHACTCHEATKSNCNWEHLDNIYIYIHLKLMRGWESEFPLGSIVEFIKYWFYGDKFSSANLLDPGDDCKRLFQEGDRNIIKYYLSIPLTGRKDKKKRDQPLNWSMLYNCNK